MSTMTTEPVATDAPAAANAEQYEVGYGKPPRRTQFKKGQSGNRRGVPKSMTVEETTVMVLRRSATVLDKGKRRRVTMQEAVVMAQIKKAIEGDHKAARLLLGLAQKAPVQEQDLSPDEADAAFREALEGLPPNALEVLSAFSTQHMAAIDRRRGKR